MTAPILQSRLPFASWMDPKLARLPGILPIEGEDWLRVDDAFAGQMAERDRLIAGHLDPVHALLPDAISAADELLEMVLARLSGSTLRGAAGGMSSISEAISRQSSRSATPR
mgnify:CR=1 FL=1